MKLALLAVLITSSAVSQTSDTWTQASPSSAPPPRGSASIAYDSVHHQVVLFGGQQPTTVLNDTWTWDGTTWTQRFPTNSPSARFCQSMAFDSDHGVVVLFGGMGDGSQNGGFLNDTWTWDGANWTQQPQQPVYSAPSPRCPSGMAYDSVHHQTVMFGGAGEGAFNDTWLWDGSIWSNVIPVNPPAARASSSMVFDLAHGVIVLFGGDIFSAFANDTWLWDGSTWTQENPQNSPSRRQLAAMAYDSVNNQTVLFGGYTGVVSDGEIQTSEVNDTWVWDGSDWTQQHPPSSPPAGESVVMAFDSTHDQAVLWDNVWPNQGSLTSTTWSWYGGPTVVTPPPPPPPPPAPSISAVLSASAFGGFASVAPGSWVEIYGSNLASVTRGWTGADFTGDIAPISLSGVSVSVGGEAAFIDYISPTQVNAQLPSTIAPASSVPLTVMNSNGTSTALDLVVNAVEPGLLAPAQFKIGTNQYVVGVLTDGSYALPAGAISGVSSRPAKPGETMVLYGVGFGAVTPAIPAGQIVSEANQLAETLEIDFGQAQAQLAYAGLAPNLVGLYQFNVVVPAVVDNNLTPVTFHLGGVPGTQTLFTAVQQ
jgi:uncharacterized protein (TIGR03437 family)